MKKIHDLDLTKTKINIYGGNESLLRVYEICVCGNHCAKIIKCEDPESQLDHKQINLISDYLNADVKGFGWMDIVITQLYEHAEILIELTKPSIDSLVINNRQETIENVHARITSFRLKDHPFVSREVDETSYSLLKSAYERLNLQPWELETILNVASTICQMDGKESIEIIHVAEAIQYRSINNRFKI